MSRRVRPFLQANAGTAAIEFALVVPILLILFAGVIEVGRAYNVYNAVNRLASQYAITYADCSDSPQGTCNTELAKFTTTVAISNIAPQITPASLTLSMFQVSMSGTTPTVVYASPSGATLTSAQIAAAQNVLTDQQSGVIVTARYTHTLQFFQSMMNATLSSYLTPTFTTVQLKG
jgi:Flp pilus assembly protein TadG